ncbi:MAG: hypothetical protein ACKN9T_02055 [Candidatus Methylumidiphilus sp.]
MAIRVRPPRSVSDIKTHSGRAKNKHETYRNYFQVGALELERWRREREREAASKRIADIDSRIADIEKEKNFLLAEAAENTVTHEAEAQPVVEKKSAGLRIKY